MISSHKNIGTHDGSFHADEVLACAMLTNYTTLYKSAIVTRTRDLVLLDKMDIVVDVGGIYNADKNRFDHHQKEFQDTFDANHKVRLSSAGLIYKHFGKEILRNLIENKIKSNLSNYSLQQDLTEDFLDILYHKLYDIFIQEVDASDNGVGQYPKDLRYEGKPLEPLFSINSSFGARVARLNPAGQKKPQMKCLVSK